MPLPLLLQDPAASVPSVAPAPSVFDADLPTILLRTAIAAGLGLVLAVIYRRTHKGLSYSQSFTQTIVYIALIVALVMLTVRNSLATAFTLVGALSIIRFRTVVKDTRDTAFVFAALAVGMAAGLGYLDLAAIGASAVALLAVVLHVTNFGAVQKGGFVLRFVFLRAQDSAAYLQLLERLARRATLLQAEPSADGASLRLVYDVDLRHGQRAEDLAAELGRVGGVSEVSVLVAKSDIDN
ncbi:MAG: DUF4956 domain-containing protein [Planctomycetota bacterium]|jgi:uncharacterized membrane protein YhiD involved in acid resistance